VDGELPGEAGGGGEGPLLLPLLLLLLLLLLLPTDVSCLHLFLPPFLFLLVLLLKLLLLLLLLPFCFNLFLLFLLFLLLVRRPLLLLLVWPHSPGRGREGGRLKVGQAPRRRQRRCLRPPHLSSLRPSLPSSSSSSTHLDLTSLGLRPLLLLLLPPL